MKKRVKACWVISRDESGNLKPMRVTTTWAETRGLIQFKSKGDAEKEIQKLKPLE